MHPELDLRVEIRVERVDGRDVEHVVIEDVGLELAGEEEGHGPRVAAADGAGVHGPGEILRQHADPAPRRRLLGARIERDDDRSLPRGQVHVHGDGGTERVRGEGDHLLGEAAQDQPRVGGGVGIRELVEKRWQIEVARAHRGGEQLLLRGEVAEDRRRGDAQGLGDVGEGSGVEAAPGKGVPGGVEDLLLRDAWRAAHVSK